MAIKYRVVLHNDLTEPYWMADDCKPVVRHKSIEEYVVEDDKKTFMAILENFLDAPKKMLTEKDIRKDFDSIDRPLSKTRVDVIKAYYNGRLALAKKVRAKLKAEILNAEKGAPLVLKFGIPLEMNYFSCEDDDPCDAMVKSNDAYIEIEVSKS